MNDIVVAATMNYNCSLTDNKSHVFDDEGGAVTLKGTLSVMGHSLRYWMEYVQQGLNECHVSRPWTNEVHLGRWYQVFVFHDMEYED